MSSTAISRIITFGSLGVLLGMAAAVQAATICHYPPGNPANVQLLSVADAAVPAHVANHGDAVCTEGNDTCCASSCTNLDSDAANCGACGNACDDGETCEDGVCTESECDIQDPCFGQQACGDDCGTVPIVEGGCFCHQGSPCSAVPTCTSSSECPSGWFCAASCCDGLRCLPPCGGDGDGDGERLVDGARSTP